MSTADALTLAINVLRDSAEAKRMPSGVPLPPASVKIHADAADHLEALRHQRPITD